MISLTLENVDSIMVKCIRWKSLQRIYKGKNVYLYIEML